MPVSPRDQETGTPRARLGVSATKPRDSERATPMANRLAWRTLVLATGALLGAGLSMPLAGCGGDSGAPATPPAPPPPHPLGWDGLPDEINVQVAETATFTATLTAAVDANYTISANTGAVEVSGEALRAGVFQGSVTGVEAGEVEVTVAASHSGFATATASFEVIVEDLFDLSLWRELVFDAFDCPNGFTDESCRNFWGERDVENRITAVLPFVPDFHLVSPGRGWTFTSTQEDTIRDAIRAAVEADHRPGIRWPGHHRKEPQGRVRMGGRHRCRERFLGPTPRPVRGSRRRSRPKASPSSTWTVWTPVTFTRWRCTKSGTPSAFSTC